MLLFNLDANYRPAETIENYDSLIWTERYRSAGEFQLKFTRDITSTLRKVSRDTLLGIQESNRSTMMVESLLIEDDHVSKLPVLTVTGRTFETFLENRIARPYPIEPLTVPWAFVNDAAGFIAYQIIRETASAAAAPAHRRVPKLNVTTTGVASGDFTAIDHKLKLGNVYERVMELLQVDDLGIRTFRPLGTDDGLTIDIYRGKDLTKELVFSTDLGHFRKVSYLWSNKGWKNAVTVYSDDQFWANDRDGEAYKGFNRREAPLEASDIRGSESNYDVYLALRTRGRSFISENTRTVALEGEVSSDLPYIFESDYSLGDRIRVLGDYGVEQLMTVTEYVRSEDRNGERMYPTLSNE